jgi:hypothetical protein
VLRKERKRSCEQANIHTATQLFVAFFNALGTVSGSYICRIVLNNYCTTSGRESIFNFECIAHISQDPPETIDRLTGHDEPDNGRLASIPLQELARFLFNE